MTSCGVWRQRGDVLGYMRGGLIDYLWTGVKATYIAIFATSFPTVRSSSIRGCINYNKMLRRRWCRSRYCLRVFERRDAWRLRWSCCAVVLFWVTCSINRLSHRTQKACGLAFLHLARINEWTTESGHGLFLRSESFATPYSELYIQR